MSISKTGCSKTITKKDLEIQYLQGFKDCSKMKNETECKIRADERAKTIREVEMAMYHQCFEVDNPEDMQKWDSGNWFRYKLFENVMEELKGGAE